MKDCIPLEPIQSLGTVHFGIVIILKHDFNEELTVEFTAVVNDCRFLQW